MFPTGNPSSSRRKEKAPVVPLTREEELEAEIADLRQFYDELQASVDGQATRIDTQNNEIDSLREALEAKHQDNQRLSGQVDSLREALEAKHQDNQRLSGQVDSHNRLIARLDGLLKEHYHSSCHASHSETDPVPSAAPAPSAGPAPSFAPVPSAAHKKAERKRQPEQPDSNDRAEELEPRKTSKNATEGEFQLVMTKKNPTAQAPGSKASIIAGPLSSPNYFRALDPEDPLKKKRGSKTQGDPSPRPAEQRYVSPPPDTLKTDAQSRTGSSGPHQPESVKNYAQMAMESTPYVLTTKSLSFAKRLAPIFRKRAEMARAVEAVKTRSREASEPLEELVGTSDEEEARRPDTNVQTDVEEATSQTRGKYWPREVL